jgi:hypothetical protein
MKPMRELQTNALAITVRGEGDLAALEDMITKAEAATVAALEGLLRRGGTARDILRAMKFEQLATHPISHEPRTLSEAINMTATTRATLEAVRRLREQFPGLEWKLSLCENGGSDIRSTDGQVAAEVYAARDYKANKKLSRCRAALHSVAAAAKFIFFSQSSREIGRQDNLERQNDNIAIINVAY